MADRVLPFDTFVDGDETVTIDSTQGIRIRAIGTDRGTALTPNIDGNDLGAVVTEVGDIHPRNTAEQGLLDLGDLYYYVPPDGTLSFDGASGDLVRLQGQRLDGVDARFESSADETRYGEQGAWHWTFEEGSVDIAEPIGDGTTHTMHTISPATDERVIVAGAQMADLTSFSGTLTDDELGVFWELDGQRWPGQFADDELFMVDIQNMPRPADDTVDQVPFDWDAYDPSMTPLSVSGDMDLDINVRNVSGGGLGSSSNTATATYTAAVQFDERR